jgi:predicted Zn finger-like uncharacterized protein
MDRLGAAVGVGMSLVYQRGEDWVYELTCPHCGTHWRFVAHIVPEHLEHLRCERCGFELGAFRIAPNYMAEEMETYGPEEQQ